MKDFLNIMKRYLPPYKHLLAFNIVFNLFSALFAVFSVALMIPILEIILSQENEVYTVVDWSLSFNTLKHNLYYYITSLKTNYGPGLALLFVGFFLVTGTFFKTCFAYMASYTSIGIRNGVVRDLRHQIYSKILELHSGYFSEEKKGDIIARSTGDVQEVENSIMSSLDMFLKNPVLIIVYLSSMFFLSVKLTLFVFVVLPIAGFIIGQVGKSLKKTSRTGQNKMGDLLGIIEETLSGLRIVKAFNAEKRMNKRFGHEVEEYRNIMNQLMRRRDLAHPMSEFLGTIVVVILVWFGGTLILTETDTISAPGFLAYLGIFYQVINPAKAFSKAHYNIQKGLGAFDRIDSVLSADTKIKESPNAIEINDVKHGIEYRNVGFAYNEGLVLKNISLNIPKGKTIALVGQSGSGKSTFVDLLPRFYDVLEGAIYIDGIDIRDLKITNLRSLMGNVNQDAILFNDTIYNNIAFGVDEATPEQVEEAARVANAHEFILATNKGYETVVGDRGGRLSGGQRQRISIARAVLKNPPVLILDEATSALDTESEKLVQEALENLMENRTSIVIAHRLSTVRNADCIYVFHDGEIVENGSHEELLSQGGVYKKLNELQMR
jgi:subfamily B ATP-binding cassette protein MsbA